MMQHILIYFLSYIGIVIFCLLIYNAYLFSKKMQCAYVIELKNKNPDIVIQTKAKVLSKNTLRLGTCKIENKVVDVILDDEPFDTISTVFFNEKTNKYYSKKKSKKDVVFHAGIDYERNVYTYKLKNRENTFLKESQENFLEKEIVVFRNPFENIIFFESEVGKKEIITEIELANKIPKNLDQYFFAGKPLSSLYEFQNKNMFDILKPTCIWAGIILAVFFGLSFLI